LFGLETLKEQFTTAAPGTLHRIVSRFGTELEQQLDLLSGQNSGTHSPHLRRIVHVLAGSSSMIGAARLAAMASRLDGLAQREEEVELLASVPALISLIRETRDAVENAKRELEAAPA
jgi:HPt (histidine-containing phosphotransfer) domain-containing protein